MDQLHMAEFWARIESVCTDPVRVLELRHVQDDTYAILEDGGIYLSDGAGVITLLKQLQGEDQ